jgi:hypothetical protein
LKISCQHSAFSQTNVERCDPLPISASAEGYKGKKTSKMTPIRLAKTIKKGLRPLGDRSVKLHFAFVFNKTLTPGWVAG